MLVNSVSYTLIIVFSLVEIHSLCTVEAVYIPTCKSNCKNGYCKHPEECECNAGYTKLKDTCVPVCERDCLHGICVAPNTCRCISGYKFLNDTCVKEQNSTRGDEDTTMTTGYPLNTMKTNKYYYNHTGTTTTLMATTSVPYFVNTSTARVVSNDANTTVAFRNEDTTTTTRDPFNTMKTNKQYYNHTGTTTTTLMTTTSVPYFVSTSTERVVGNNANTTVALGDPMEKSYWQQHGRCIWIPIILIVTTGLILLLIWQRIPMKIVNFFKGRSYDVHGAFLKRNESSWLGRLEFMSDEWEEQSELTS